MRLIALALSAASVIALSAAAATAARPGPGGRSDRPAHAAAGIAAPVLSARRVGGRIRVHWRVGDRGNPIALAITAHSSDIRVPPSGRNVRTSPARRHGTVSLRIPYGPGPYTVKGSSFSKTVRSVVRTFPVR